MNQPLLYTGTVRTAIGALDKEITALEKSAKARNISPAIWQGIKVSISIKQDARENLVEYLASITGE